MVKNILNNFLDLKTIKGYSRYISGGTILARVFKRFSENSFKNVHFEKRNASWIGGKESISKNYKNLIYSTIKKTP